MRRRAVAAAMLAMVAVASTAAAAPRPHVEDAKGDAVLASHDILSMTFSTVGTGANAELQMRVELAGPPNPDVGHYWAVSWRSPGCARTDVIYTRSVFYPGEDRAQMGWQCKAGDEVKLGYPATGRLEGSSLILRVPLGRRYRPGTMLSEPFVTSYAAVYVASGMPSYYRADSTDQGREYRVGSRG
ncbi:MAG TPA: hypothetical protein VNA12_01410 [Mycobacteriales bacterium]|nr:hypothetical protein [Mycobacteriales bacterium]